MGEKCLQNVLVPPLLLSRSFLAAIANSCSDFAATSQPPFLDATANRPCLARTANCSCLAAAVESSVFSSYRELLVGFCCYFKAALLRCKCKPSLLNQNCKLFLFSRCC